MIGQEILHKDTLFNRTVENLKENKLLRESGKHITIPFGFPRLNKLHPGISRLIEQGVNAEPISYEKIIKNQHG